MGSETELRAQVPEAKKDAIALSVELGVGVQFVLSALLAKGYDQRAARTAIWDLLSEGYK